MPYRSIEPTTVKDPAAPPPHPGEARRDYAFFVDNRLDFDGIIKAGEGDGTEWSTLGKHLFDTHRSENNNTWYIPFTYEKKLALNSLADMPPKWRTDTDRDPGKEDHIMDDVLETAQKLLVDKNPEVRINYKNNEYLAMADTAVLLTDDFFDDGDFAYERYFFRVYNQFRDLCENYHVAVLAYQLDYLPLKSDYYKSQDDPMVKRIVYIVVVSRRPESLWNYCRDLLALSKQEGSIKPWVAWNKPQTGFIINGEDVDEEAKGVPLVSLAEQQDGTALYTEVFPGMLGFQAGKSEDFQINLSIGDKPVFEGLWADCNETGYERTVKWELVCESIYLLDWATGELGEKVKLSTNALSPIRIDEFPSTITFTVPMAGMDSFSRGATDNYYHYVCRFALRATYSPELHDPLVNWAGNRELVLDSTCTEDSLLLFSRKSNLKFPDSAGNNRTVPLSDLEKNQALFVFMKDEENKGLTSKTPTRMERNSRKTLWLNRLVNYENFVRNDEDNYSDWYFDVLVMK